MPHATAHPLRGLLIAQFFGAFNDNAWKLMVALLAIRQATASLQPGPDYETAVQTQTAITFVMFTLPLVLFSLIGGTLADRLSKRTVIIALKAVEVLLMAAGAFVLWRDPAGWLLPLIVLCGMGAQSALFSPSKYGILPELVPHERLAAANGLLEMWTFAAILTGTAAGGFLLQAAGNEPWLAATVLIALSIVGLIASFQISPVSSARSEGGVAATVHAALASIRAERLLRLTIAGEIFFGPSPVSSLRMCSSMPRPSCCCRMTSPACRSRCCQWASGSAPSSSADSQSSVSNMV